MRRDDVRSVAVIAHVDHGKTTLVDGFLRQAGAFRAGEVVAERALDTNELERERGITILAKCTAITWNGVRVNIVDTPGHADFGGEVERILGMVDGVLLLVDAFEGPMPQTRFVTKKALALGLRPVLVVNKCDRAGCDPHGTVDGVFDLMVALGASNAQIDFAIAFASGREGWAVRDVDKDERRDLAPLLDLIVEAVPPPEVVDGAALAMQVATLEYDDYLGYSAIGRIMSGSIAPGERRLRLARDGAREEFRVQKLLGFQALRRFELAEASAGDIVAVTGMEELSVGETITDIEAPVTDLPPLAVDEPTITMQFVSSDGPFVGREGRWVTSRNLRDRLFKEVRSNVALRVRETDRPDVFEVAGRGELHLAILIETMRREGYEMCVSQPQVIVKEETGADGARVLREPYEEVGVDVDQAYSGAVIEELGRRGGRMTEMRPEGEGRVRIEWVMPARGLIGYRSQMMTDTRGTGVLRHMFCEWGAWADALRGRVNGVLIVKDAGTTSAYALFNLQERGALIVGPGVEVYAGQIVGVHSRDNDLVVNPSIGKKLTNIRTTAADEKLLLTPPRPMPLEAALEFINADELVEVTPKAIRLRKRILDHNARKRAAKQANAIAAVR